MEIQYIGPTPMPESTHWVLPTVGFELERRAAASYFTVCLIAGRSIVRLRLYWNVHSAVDAG